MRVAFIGVSHWHTAFYADPIAARDDVEVVGVADPEDGRRGEWAAKLRTVAFADYREMCAAVQPEFVFALGRHSEMADEVRFLIESGIPFMVEKPAATSVARIEELSTLARERNVFAAVAFAFRYSSLRSLMAEYSPGKRLTYAMFRHVPGPASRYSGPDAWNLDPAVAGGGCTLNLSVHYFDLLRALAPEEPWTVAGAGMRSSLSGSAVEDFSAVVLESGDRMATVETGYIFPTTEGSNVFSVCAEGDYYNWVGRDREIVVTLADGREQRFPAGLSQSAFYGDLVDDALRRVREGRAPESGLDDMVEAAKLARQAYVLAGRPELFADALEPAGDSGER